jgi:hypothetical protein
MDAIRPFMTSNAPNCGRILKLSQYPPAGNCSLSQFLSGQNSNSFSGETLFRLTDPVQQDASPNGSMAINSHTTFTARLLKLRRFNQEFRLVTAGALYSLHGQMRGALS